MNKVKQIMLIIIAIVLLIAAFNIFKILGYTGKKNIELNSKKIVNQRLDIMPVPKYPIYIEYNSTKRQEPISDEFGNLFKEKYKGDESVISEKHINKTIESKSKCIYVGKENSMAFSSNDTSYVFNKNNNALYCVTASSIIYPDKVDITLESTIQIFDSESNSILDYIPGLGIYQPEKDFLNKHV